MQIRMTGPGRQGPQVMVSDPQQRGEVMEVGDESTVPVSHREVEQLGIHRLYGTPRNQEQGPCQFCPGGACLEE